MKNHLFHKLLSKIFVPFTLSFLFVVTSVFAKTAGPKHTINFDDHLQASLAWDINPAPGGPFSFVLQFKDQNTNEIVSLKELPKVDLFMPSMGHGSLPPKVQIVTEKNGQTQAGSYLISEVYFVMKGDWDVRITILNSRGQEETKSLSLYLD